MEHEFWHHKWEIKQTGFHLEYVHPLLKRNLNVFSVADGIFVPLCGKTLDIGYLLSFGHRIVGVELSELAVNELFQQLELTPNISTWCSGANEGKIYQADKLTIYVGDFFALQAKDLGDISVVYDRAALIALPKELRIKYCQHIQLITQQAPQLLITLDYDQSIAGGPPFAVSSEEVEMLYSDAYTIDLLEEADILDEEPRFKAKGLTALYQRAYQLNKN